MCLVIISSLVASCVLLWPRTAAAGDGDVEDEDNGRRRSAVVLCVPDNLAEQTVEGERIGEM